MSRVGKKPIEIPQGVDVDIRDEKITAKGPLGELSLSIPREVEVKKGENEIIVSEKRNTKKSRSLWGTTRSLVFNIIKGVHSGFRKELQIKGVGYRAEMQGNKLVLRVGFSHPVEIDPLPGINFEVNKDIISVSGIEKEKVGQAAAELRKVRPPDPYKGKGIRYKDEIIVLKEGKKAAGK